MTGILLSQKPGFILGPIAKLLGAILNVIFNIVPNIGVSIIIFTIVIYLALLPLTYKQQKFSKLSAKMNPELKDIQERYKNKKDQVSMQRQNEEMQAVYKKYGVSPTGSCLQLIIQMPILFALYRVIYNIPDYVTKIYDCLEPLAQSILSAADGVKTISGLNVVTKYFSSYIKNNSFSGEQAVHAIVDVLNRATSSEWNEIGKIAGLDQGIYESVRTQFEAFNNFLGLNISNSPMFILKEAFSAHNYLLVIGAVMVPLLAAVTQWLNTLFMPQPAQGNGSDTMSSTMKSMNLMMPIFSAVFCLNLPCGMGIYWISGAVVRCIQQIVINRHIDKIDMDALIEKNMENYKKKHQSEDRQTVTGNASIRAKSIEKKSSVPKEEREEAIRKAEEAYQKGVAPGSITDRANMVRRYNEKNSDAQ